jgi:hypothetical protein
VSNRGFYSGFNYEDLGDSSVTIMRLDRLGRFVDPFPDAGIDGGNWPETTGDPRTHEYQVASPPYSAWLDANDTLVSRIIDMSHVEAGELRFSLSRRAAPTARLHIGFWDGNGWLETMAISGGNDEYPNFFRSITTTVPSAALRNGTRVRFRASATSPVPTNDQWFLDDVAVTVQHSDCNFDGLLDSCAIRDDASLDRNLNRRLDRCEFDVDGDADVDLRDLGEFLNCFSGSAAPSPTCADRDFFENQMIDAADFSVLSRHLSGP